MNASPKDAWTLAVVYAIVRHRIQMLALNSCYYSQPVITLNTIKLMALVFRYLFEEYYSLLLSKRYYYK